MAKSNSNNKQSITATISVDSVVFALKMNATHSADDRVIAVPQKDNAKASIRRAFRGSERYSNPQSAPVHIKPERLVDDGWERPPGRHEVDMSHMPVPDVAEKRDEEDEEMIDQAHSELIEIWETDVRGMIADSHEVVGKETQITLICETKDQHQSNDD